MRDSCRHFTGIMSRADGSRIDLFSKERGQCKAGVYYDTVLVKGVGLPCFPPSNGKPCPDCSKREAQTPEEIAQREAEIKEAVERFEKTGPLVRRIKTEHKGKDWQGVEECPICKGKLHMTHAAYNGHTWGKCETDDCVSWIE